jgi:hypothetical protein
MKNTTFRKLKNTEKFKPFVRNASSESVKTCLDRLRMKNFLDAEAGVEEALFC